MFITFVRTIIMYIFVIAVIRLMGKRQIGELEPSELVVTIVISEVAAMPIQESSQPIASSVIAIALLLIMEVIISFAAYKNRFFRKILYGTPSVLFSKGKLNQKEMEKERFNVNDLMGIIRNNGAAGFDEVDFVIVETNGNVSVIMNSDNKTVTTGDLNIKAEPVELSYVVIEGGKVNEKNLKSIGFNRKWLDKQLVSNSVKDTKDIFCMSADKNGKVYIIKKEKNQ